MYSILYLEHGTQAILYRWRLVIIYIGKKGHELYNKYYFSYTHTSQTHKIINYLFYHRITIC